MSRVEYANQFANPIDIRHVLKTSPPAQDHVLPGLLAGTVGMLAGPGGIGKTMFELQLALALACGGSICGGLFEEGGAAKLHKQEPGKVVLVAAEESVDVIWQRLHAVVCTLLKTPGFSGLGLAGTPRVTLMSRDLASTKATDDLMAACDGARLLIVDPIRRFHTCDENDSAAMTAFVQILQEIASHTQAAVIFAHHTNRVSQQMGQGDTAGAARGSTALSDGVRWQLNLSRPSKETARHLDVDADAGNLVLVDIPKANYLPAQATAVLRRLDAGVLQFVQMNNTIEASKADTTTRPVQRRRGAPG